MLQKVRENPQQSHYLTIKEAAKYLGVHAATIRRWATTKVIKGRKIGIRGDWRFTQEELLEIAKSNYVASDSFPSVLSFQENQIAINSYASELQNSRTEQIKLATFVDNTFDAIFLWQLQGTITYWNKGAEELYGYTKKDALGKETHVLLKTIHPVPFKKIEKILLLTGRWEGELIHTAKNKQQVIVSCKKVLFTDHNGYQYVLETNRDISKQKENERLKDEFISMASHELKTPITSMKIFLEVLNEHLTEVSDKKGLAYSKRITDQTNKMKDLVNDLLDLSRISVGKLQVKKEKFNLVEVVKDTIEGLQPSAKKHKLILKANEIVVVYADKFRIYQVVTNLVNNAIKYSPNETKIIIAVKKKTGDAVVSVKDYGIGIDKDNQQKIFEKLYQVTDTEVKTFPGLGMGLFISSEIIKQHDGQMWVESKKGKGAIFYFSLPLRKNSRVIK